MYDFHGLLGKSFDPWGNNIAANVSYFRVLSRIIAVSRNHLLCFMTIHENRKSVTFIRQIQYAGWNQFTATWIEVF